MPGKIHIARCFLLIIFSVSSIYAQNVQRTGSLQDDLSTISGKLSDDILHADTLQTIAVEFHENLTQLNGNTMGYDAQEHPAHSLYYNIMVLPGNEKVAVPWVATKAGAGGSVKAKFIENDSIQVEDILFKSGSDGASLTAQLSGNEWTVSLPAVAKDQLLVINAVDKQGATVGKLNAAGYEEIKRKVHIVPVGTTTAGFKGADLANYLNRIYAQAGASWEVEMEAAITIEGFDGTLQDDEQALLSTYSDGMKAIINGYKNTDGITIIEEEFYLFLVDKSQTGKSGYMPRKHRYGFIYMGEGGDKLRTIAHELGHGAFRLQHTWEEYPTISEGSTENLMDYGTGTNLRKYQWDLIHNPPVVVGLVEDLGEGAQLGDKKTACFNVGENYGNTYLTFVTPEGNSIKLTEGSEAVAFYYDEDENLEGTLAAFYDELGDLYASGFSRDEKGNTQWQGYRKTSDTKVEYEVQSGSNPVKVYIDHKTCDVRITSPIKDSEAITGLSDCKCNNLPANNTCVSDTDIGKSAESIKVSYTQFLKKGQAIYSKSSSVFMFQYERNNGELYYFSYYFDELGNAHYLIWKDNCWYPYDFDGTGELQQFASMAEVMKAMYDDCKKNESSMVHCGLDILGFIPILGSPFDALNGVIYFTEGELLLASLSMTAVLVDGVTFAKRLAPVFMKAGKVVKHVAGLVEKYYELIKFVRASTSLTSEGIIKFEKQLDKILTLTQGDKGGEVLIKLLDNSNGDYGKVIAVLSKTDGFTEASIKSLVDDLGASDELIAQFVRNPELVDSWAIIKNSGDDDLAKLATNLDELDLVSKNLDEIESVDGYKLWKNAIKKFDEYIQGLKTKVNPRKNLDDGVFERRVTGDDIQYEAIGGGEKIWADGVNSSKRALLDAKHNPGNFYTLDSYNQKPFLYGDLEDEFRRYAKIIADETNPTEGLIIYISRESENSVSLFEHLASKYNVPTKVELDPWTP